MMGPVLGATSEKFFYNYNNILKGFETEFEFTPSIGGGVKFELFKGCRLGIDGSFYNARLVDGYWLTMISGTDTTRALFNEDIDINTQPIIVSFEIVPYYTQFRTYVGIGFGLTFSTIKWKENVYSDLPLDKRKGGLLFDESNVSSAFRCYTGVELGFDKRRSSSFLGSLIIEARYTYIGRSVNIFDKLSKQFEEPPLEWNSGILILPGYICLNLAISFNYNKSTRLLNSIVPFLC